MQIRVHMHRGGSKSTLAIKLRVKDAVRFLVERFLKAISNPRPPFLTVQMMLRALRLFVPDVFV